jgi:hypothetical protein
VPDTRRRTRHVSASMGRAQEARLDAGEAIGPRTELILEMREKSGQKFHLATVQQFLVHARRYLFAQVSDSAPGRRIDAADEDEDSDGPGALRPVMKGRSPTPAELALAASIGNYWITQQASKSSTSSFAAQLAKTNIVKMASANQLGASQLAALASANRAVAQLAASGHLNRVNAQFAGLSRLAAFANPSSTHRMAEQLARFNRQFPGPRSMNRLAEHFDKLSAAASGDITDDTDAPEADAEPGDASDE